MSDNDSNDSTGSSGGSTGSHFGNPFGPPGGTQETQNLPPFAPPSSSVDSAAAEEGLTRTELVHRRVGQILNRVRDRFRKDQSKSPRAGATEARGPVLGTSTATRLPMVDLRNLSHLSQVMGQRALQGRGYAFYGTLATVIVCAFFLADVAAMMVGNYIPEPPAARSLRSSPSMMRGRAIDAYNPIFARNLFNRKGLIPGEDNPMGDPGGAPVKTTLPFTLVGTMILRDAARSLATIVDSSAAQTYPVRVDDEIPGKARILKVEPTRVIFVNLASNRREFVDLPEDILSGGAPQIQIGSGGIEQQAPNQYSVDRKEVDKAFSNLNNILTQAKATPNFENGVPTGFKLTQIVQGSIYDKLGLKDGDVITGADGSPINDPMKAMEMLNKLKESSHLALQVKHDGRTVTYDYDIH